MATETRTKDLIAAAIGKVTAFERELWGEPVLNIPGRRFSQVKATRPPKTVETASSGRKLTLLGKGSGAVEFEFIATKEVTFLVEVMGDRGRNLFPLKGEEFWCAVTS